LLKNITKQRMSKEFPFGPYLFASKCVMQISIECFHVKFLSMTNLDRQLIEIASGNLKLWKEICNTNKRLI